MLLSCARARAYASAMGSSPGVAVVRVVRRVMRRIVVAMRWVNMVALRSCNVMMGQVVHASRAGLARALEVGGLLRVSRLGHNWRWKTMRLKTPGLKSKSKSSPDLYGHFAVSLETNT